VGYAIIEVPAMAGEPTHPAAAGPATITAALERSGYRLPLHRVSVRPFEGSDARAASIEVGGQVKELARAIVAGGDVPVALAGSCDVAPAMLAGIQHTSVGVVWIDAHADFNTPQSSASGFWPGMTLAVVVGDCGEEVWSALGWRAVAPERVLLMGVRSLSPAQEARRLQESSMLVVRWQDGLPQEDVETSLDRLSDRAEQVYVHLDLDALDPSVGAGVVDPPVAGGLSGQQLGELLSKVRERFAVVGATIATYTPANDQGSTLAVVIDAIRRLLGNPREGG
jgi:arginase